MTSPAHRTMTWQQLTDRVSAGDEDAVREGARRLSVVADVLVGIFTGAAETTARVAAVLRRASAQSDVPRTTP